jgi:plasmid stability protein
LDIATHGFQPMAQILVRGLDDKVVARLKNRAATNGHSLESEARSILESATGFTAEEARRIIREWQKRFAGRKFSDSVELLHEDRRR